MKVLNKQEHALNIEWQLIRQVLWMNECKFDVLVELFDHKVREMCPKSQSRPWEVLQQTCDESSPAYFHTLTTRMHNGCKTVMPAS